MTVLDPTAKDRDPAEYEEMMNREAARVYALWKRIPDNVEWHTFSDEDLGYFSRWAEYRFGFDEDDERLLKFADCCVGMVDHPSRSQVRASFARLKGMLKSGLD